MLVQMLLLVFRDATPRGRNKEKKKKKKAVEPNHTAPSANAPTTRNSAPQVQQACQDRCIARAKAGTPAGTTAGAATRHARLRKEDAPACGKTQSRTIGSPSSRSKLLTPAFFRFLSRTGCKSATRRNHTKQHATAPAANCLHEEPEIARIANTLSDPQTARSAFSISCLEQPGFAAQAVPLKWSFN